MKALIPYCRRQSRRDFSLKDFKRHAFSGNNSFHVSYNCKLTSLYFPPFCFFSLTVPLATQNHAGII